MKLSFIIPLYNAEAFIGKCLDSILQSNIEKTEYEVIVIDDGSSDNGLSVAKDYECKNVNIRVLTQSNQGQSVARNYGIREAKGDYIWCIDSDDYTDSKFLGVLNLINKQPTLDIVAVQLKKVHESGEYVSIECQQPSVRHNTIMKGRDAVISGYNPSSVCALIVRKALIEKYNLYFYEGITHQDVELSYRLMSHASDVIFTDFVPYIYVLHTNSTSQSLTPKKKIKYVSDEIIIIQSFMKLSKEFTESDKEMSYVIENRAKNILFGMVVQLHSMKKLWAPLGINDVILTRLKETGFYPLTISFDSWKKNLYKYILNIEGYIK